MSTQLNSLLIERACSSVKPAGYMRKGWSWNRNGPKAGQACKVGGMYREPRDRTEEPAAHTGKFSFFVTGVTASLRGFCVKVPDKETVQMRADHCKLRQVSIVETELSDSELEKVVAGAGTKTLQANANRFDPYKTFRFRVC